MCLGSMKLFVNVELGLLNVVEYEEWELWKGSIPNKSTMGFTAGQQCLGFRFIPKVPSFGHMGRFMRFREPLEAQNANANTESTWNAHSLATLKDPLLSRALK